MFSPFLQLDKITDLHKYLIIMYFVFIILQQEDESQKSLPLNEQKENSLEKDLSRSEISNWKKMFIFIIWFHLVSFFVSIFIPLAITNEKTGNLNIFIFIPYSISFIPICHFHIFPFLVKPYSCLPGYCSSIYGKSIIGNNNSVARACAMDPNCKAFRYSSQNGFGFLCDNLDRKKGYDDWELCGFWSGKMITNW